MAGIAGMKKNTERDKNGKFVKGKWKPPKPTVYRECLICHIQFVYGGIQGMYMIHLCPDCRSIYGTYQKYVRSSPEYIAKYISYWKNLVKQNKKPNWSHWNAKEVDAMAELKLRVGVSTGTTWVPVDFLAKDGKDGKDGKI